MLHTQTYSLINSMEGLKLNGVLDGPVKLRADAWTQLSSDECAGMPGKAHLSTSQIHLFSSVKFTSPEILQSQGLINWIR